LIVAKAPLRCSIFGGGTDYRKWFEVHGGSVLGFAVNKYVRVYVRDLLPFNAFKHMLVYRKVEQVNKIEEIEHPAIRAVLQEHWGDNKGGLEITHMGDLPACSGMGSSSAFVVALLAAIWHKIGRKFCDGDIAREAIRIEQEVIGENVGNQDQIWAAMGGYRRLDFVPGTSTVCWRPQKRSEELLSHLMLVFTGFTRIADLVAGEQIKAFPKHEHELSAIQMSVDVAEAILSHEDQDIRKLGPILLNCWKNKRQLSDHVSNSIIDGMLDKAIKAGALGGKLLGAGNGGFLLLFVEPINQERVKAALPGKIWVPLGISEHGVTVWDES
jgi:D-glycero-alpha-D-manno-heptose-7-phosphate kinase